METMGNPQCSIRESFLLLPGIKGEELRFSITVQTDCKSKILLFGAHSKRGIEENYHLSIEKKAMSFVAIHLTGVISHHITGKIAWMLRKVSKITRVSS